MGFLLFLLACNDHCLTKDHLDYFIGEWWQGYHSGETVTGCYLFEEAGIIIEDNGEDKWPIAEWDTKPNECGLTIVTPLYDINLKDFTGACWLADVDNREIIICDCLY